MRPGDKIKRRASFLKIDDVRLSPSESIFVGDIKSALNGLGGWSCASGPTARCTSSTCRY